MLHVNNITIKIGENKYDKTLQDSDGGTVNGNPPAKAEDSVPSLVWEDPTRPRAPKPRATAPEPGPAGPVLHQKPPQRAARRDQQGEPRSQQLEEARVQQ